MFWAQSPLQSFSVSATWFACLFFVLMWPHVVDRMSKSTYSLSDCPSASVCITLCLSFCVSLCKSVLSLDSLSLSLLWTRTRDGLQGLTLYWTELKLTCIMITLSLSTVVVSQCSCGYKSCTLCLFCIRREWWLYHDIFYTKFCGQEMEEVLQRLFGSTMESDPHSLLVDQMIGLFRSALEEVLILKDIRSIWLASLQTDQQ